MNLKPLYLLGVVEVILLTFLGVWFFHWQDMKKQAASSSPVTSTPSPEEPASPETSAATPSTPDCHRGGCSGQLCTDVKDIISTCEWSETYDCYQHAECARQRDGKCGFTQTSELQTCLQEKGKDSSLAPEASGSVEGTTGGGERSPKNAGSPKPG